MAQINDTDGVRVVMSPAQLAAVVSGQSISQSDTAAAGIRQVWIHT